MANDSIVKEAGCNDVVINIPRGLGPVVWPNCCIYRVPRQLREVNKAAYTPKLVSIGPFHHGLKELKDMEIHKLRYFRDFFDRDRVKKSQKELATIIKKKEEEIRQSYSDDCTLMSEDFVQMILLDAIFIIELFLKTYSFKTHEKDEDYKSKTHEKDEDYISKTPCMANCIQRDLILLENQLPLSVLKELYAAGGCCESSGPSFFELSKLYFSGYGLTNKDSFEKAKHFIDLIRYSFCGYNKSYGSSDGGSLDTLICASKLDDAGLSFKANIDGGLLLDIKLGGCWERFECVSTTYCLACLPIYCICLICFPFWKCFCCLFEKLLMPDCLFGHPINILEVPQLVIDHNTEAIFRNLMALEQCLYPSATHICNYVLLLDRLIDTEKDVNLLVDKNIIVNRLGSNAQVVPLINKLGHHIERTTSSFFHDLVKNLNKHYEFPLNHFLATLKREYFTNIFRGTATVVGLIVLGFTLWNFLRPFVVEN